MILLREEGITPIAQELVEELQAIPNLKLVCFDPLQAFTTGMFLAVMKQANFGVLIVQTLAPDLVVLPLLFIILIKAH